LLAPLLALPLLPLLSPSLRFGVQRALLSLLVLSSVDESEGEREDVVGVVVLLLWNVAHVAEVARAGR